MNNEIMLNENKSISKNAPEPGKTYKKAESEGFIALSPMQVVNLFNEESEQKSIPRIIQDCNFPLQDELKVKIRI